ncbi:MAG: ferredoxin [Mycobacteriaceae bacterium]
MQVVVDFDRCEANGVCIGYAPDIFDLDEQDNLLVKSGDIPEAEISAVENAISQCPRAALRWKS